MSEEQMRQWLCAQYPHSKSWHSKVAKMPSGQVFSIYKRLSNRTRRG